MNRRLSSPYPNLAWVRRELRANLVSRRRGKVLAAYVVGSEARGTAKRSSDLDIAVVIPRVRGKTALQVSEHYHSKFTGDRLKPKWGGRTVDFQFFYPGDLDLAHYEKIGIRR